MSKYTKADILKLAQENDVKFIRLQFTDILGTLKNVAITTSQLEKALDNKCMVRWFFHRGLCPHRGIRHVPSPRLRHLRDLSGARSRRVARLICDVYKPDGTPFEGDPRYVLRKALKEAADMGFTFNVGPECEFFLFQTDEQGHPTTIPLIPPAILTLARWTSAKTCGGILC